MPGNAINIRLLIGVTYRLAAALAPGLLLVLEPSISCGRSSAMVLLVRGGVGGVLTVFAIMVMMVVFRPGMAMVATCGRIELAVDGHVVGHISSTTSRLPPSRLRLQAATVAVVPITSRRSARHLPPRRVRRMRTCTDPMGRRCGNARAPEVSKDQNGKRDGTRSSLWLSAAVSEQSASRRPVVIPKSRK